MKVSNQLFKGTRLQERTSTLLKGTRTQEMTSTLLNNSPLLDYPAHISDASHAHVDVSCIPSRQFCHLGLGYSDLLSCRSYVLYVNVCLMSVLWMLMYVLFMFCVCHVCQCMSVCVMSLVLNVELNLSTSDHILDRFSRWVKTTLLFELRWRSALARWPFCIALSV